MKSRKASKSATLAKKVTWSDIQAYLDAIADRPGNAGDIDSASHGRFWNIAYQSFIAGTVPNEDCGGAPIPNVNPDPNLCALYQALTGPKGWCQLGQMPLGGPVITGNAYLATLKDGTKISGADIATNMLVWIKNGMPEH
jgi:hypothetical protein